MHEHNGKMTSDPKPNRLSEARVALMTLTRLPAGRLTDPVPSMAAARWAFPLVGVAVGVIVALVFAVAGMLGVPSILAALLAVGAGMLATGALHEDGLADCADGFWGGRDRDRKVEIMRDSRIGTYGTLALILVVALRATSLASLADALWSIIGVAVLSRFAMVAAIERMSPAQPDGLGATVAEGASQLRLAALVSLLGVFALWMSVGFVGALIVLVVGGLAGLWVAGLARRHIGGQTGDVLGCMQQVTETAGLIALTAIVT